MLKSENASSGVSLPELDGVIVPGRGQDDLARVFVDHLQIVLARQRFRGQTHFFLLNRFIQKIGIKELKMFILVNVFLDRFFVFVLVEVVVVEEVSEVSVEVGVNGSVVGGQLGQEGRVRAGES